MAYSASIGGKATKQNAKMRQGPKKTHETMPLQSFLSNSFAI
jgi:hypothetical protein